MTCLEAGRVLDAYVDNELEPAAAADLQAHLALCAGCRELVATREALGRLVRRLPYYSASDELRAKIARSTTRPRFNTALLTWAAVLALAASLGGSVGIVRFARAKLASDATVAVADEIVGDHVRALGDYDLQGVRLEKRGTEHCQLPADRE